MNDRDHLTTSQLYQIKKENEMKEELELLKQENERLKAEITRLSDPFLHAPDYMEWFAVDKTGDATW